MLLFDKQFMVNWFHKVTKTLSNNRRPETKQNNNRTFWKPQRFSVILRGIPNHNYMGNP